MSDESSASGVVVGPAGKYEPVTILPGEGAVWAVDGQVTKYALPSAGSGLGQVTQVAFKGKPVVWDEIAPVPAFVGHTGSAPGDHQLIPDEPGGVTTEITPPTKRKRVRRPIGHFNVKELRMLFNGMSRCINYHAVTKEEKEVLKRYHALIYSMIGPMSAKEKKAAAAKGAVAEPVVEPKPTTIPSSFKSIFAAYSDAFKMECLK